MGKGFKHGVSVYASGGGGGSGDALLNFEVVGGTYAPANPRENTIWVNTATAIPGWHFGADEPNAAEGTVWIQTGTSSVAPFNALKENSVMVYPIAAKVYDGTQFSLAGASIYQDGEWKQFSSAWDGVLFDAGNQYDSVTGGWVNASGDTLTASHFSNQTFGDPVHTEKMIDLTDFDTLHVTYSGVTVEAHFGVTKIRDLNLAADYAASEEASVGTVALDVSGLTGEYYVTLVAGAETGGVTCAFTATKVWLT